MYQPNPANQSPLTTGTTTSAPGQASTAPAPAPAPAAPAPSGLAVSTSSASPTFLDELTRVMHTTAERQRAQIAADLAGNASAQAEKARTRGAAEAEELRRLSEQDANQIRGLAMIEIDRIRAEAERQVGERQERLTANLGQHATIVEAEVRGIDQAAAQYLQELDAFFARLGGETDPVEIARLADHLPGQPDFEAARASARADAVARISAAAAMSETADVSAAGQPEASTPSADASVFTVSAAAARWFRSFMTWAQLAPTEDNKPSDPAPTTDDSESEPALTNGR
jgi:hypothetical protein